MDQARLITLIGGVVAGLILGVLGAGAVLVAGYFRRRATRAQGWPSTVGVVTSVHVNRYSHESGGDYYVPDVMYQYQVGSQAYKNSRVNFDIQYQPDLPTPEAAQNKFPLGQPVTVYYNPRNPADAVLLRKEFSSTGFIIMAGIIFVLALCFPPLFVIAGIAAMGS